jgi:predicted nucleic acid-binding Zn ribbon protein
VQQDVQQALREQVCDSDSHLHLHCLLLFVIIINDVFLLPEYYFVNKFSSDEEVDEVVEDWLDTDSIVLEEVSPRNLRMAISKSSSSGGGSSFYISRCNSSSSSSSSSSGSSSSDGSVNSSGGSSLEQLDVEDWLCEDDDVVGSEEVRTAMS